jgi:hypothetical protein
MVNPITYIIDAINTRKRVVKAYIDNERLIAEYHSEKYECTKDTSCYNFWLIKIMEQKVRRNELRTLLGWEFINDL